METNERNIIRQLRTIGNNKGQLETIRDDKE